MKQQFIRALGALAFSVLFLHAPARAGTLSAIQTGLDVLDTALNAINRQAEGADGAVQVVDEIQTAFNLSSSVIRGLTGQGYSYGEIYYLGLLQKQTGQSLEEIIKQRKPGTGWGDLAHQLGIHPSTLNKRRVSLKKEYKAKKKDAAQDQDDQTASTTPGKSGKDKGKGKESAPGQAKKQGKGQQ